MEVIVLTARRPALRAVGKDEKPPAPRRARAKSVTQAAKSGSARELLVATRDRIAVAVENPNTPARDLAALTKRLMETVREIEAIDAREAQGADGGAEVSDAAFDAEAI